MKYEQFIIRLREMASEMGSQKALAEKLGVTQSYLSDVLNGRREPGPKMLAALGLEAEKVFKKKADGEAA